MTSKPYGNPETDAAYHAFHNRRHVPSDRAEYGSEQERDAHYAATELRARLFTADEFAILSAALVCYAARKFPAAEGEAETLAAIQEKARKLTA